MIELRRRGIKRGRMQINTSDDASMHKAWKRNQTTLELVIAVYMRKFCAELRLISGDINVWHVL